MGPAILYLKPFNYGYINISYIFANIERSINLETYRSAQGNIKQIYDRVQVWTLAVCSNHGNVASAFSNTFSEEVKTNITVHFRSRHGSGRSKDFCIAPPKRSCLIAPFPIRHGPQIAAVQVQNDFYSVTIDSAIFFVSCQPPDLARVYILDYFDSCRRIKFRGCIFSQAGR